MEGVKVLFRISIALLIRHQKVLLRQTDTLAFWKSMKTTASLAYDFDELLKIAFGGFKMIKRKELRYRQEGQRRELEKRIRQSSLFNDSSPNMKNNIVAEACAPKPSRLFCVSALGEASPSFLMCQEEGQHCGLKLCNTDEDVFYPMNFKFDAPILCAAWMDDRRLLLGSAEGYIYAFSVEQRMNSWELKMPSCVTAIAIGRRDDGTQHAFDLTCEMAPRDQYSQILGFIAVSSIAIVEDQVWCACGCVVEVFNVKTFDHVSKITVSDDPLDSVLCLAPCSNGVWISIAGKTVLDLWSTSTFQPISCCNVQEYLPSRNLGQDADADENPDRVTAVLTNQSNLFIGTGSGVVLIYKILKWKNQAMIQSRSRSTVYRRSATIDDDVDVSKRQDWDTPHGSFAGKDDRDGNANNSSVESVDRKHSKSSLQDFDNSLPPVSLSLSAFIYTYTN
ncbi:unnamed protein product [Mesocestoides corti]|uniref:Uncharacterized protein n=1 Tax=Mesocestoides corti TaxID=53468 RepID=A0A3P6HB22_MESCO|nr:unnamed protein product [Mesocestoides corti]